MTYLQRVALAAAMEEIGRLREENDSLRAELARIKPSWDDAPEWADELVLSTEWLGDNVIQRAYALRKVIYRIEEHRPEATE